MTHAFNSLVATDRAGGAEAILIRHIADFVWDGAPVLKYKEQDTTFKDITRQVFFRGREDLPCELRYFEIAPQGHSTLECHEHVHLVMILRGEGDALLGDSLQHLAAHDFLVIPPGMWHQFRATCGEPFGFICLVAAERDRPKLPTPAELARLRQDPVVAEFIRT